MKDELENIVLLYRHDSMVLDSPYSEIFYSC